jgi:hypothetical protein
MVVAAQPAPVEGSRWPMGLKAKRRRNAGWSVITAPRLPASRRAAEPARALLGVKDTFVGNAEKNGSTPSSVLFNVTPVGRKNTVWSLWRCRSIRNGDADYSQLATTLGRSGGRGDAPVLPRMKVQHVRTRPDVSCCELIDVVQATEYRICDDLSGFSAETWTEVLPDRAVSVARSIDSAAND